MEQPVGLTDQEAARRRAEGQGNVQALPPTKTVGAILWSNLVTPFNLLNAVLAVLVILAGSGKNALFMGVILCNVVIGTVQELRAKAVIDKLSLIAAPHAKVFRDGQVVTLALEELVRDDVVKLDPGDQVGADCVILEGQCRMDESLLTGESEPEGRGQGDTLLSGSYVASGHCLARVVHVGAENYAAQITAQARYVKRPHSEIMACVNQIIRAVGVILAPLGIALFIKQYVFVAGVTWQEAVVKTVAALVGMIPEGLVLLTSVVLAVSVVRLSRRGALAQELHSVEMLARVDVLCLDKTGTLTTGELSVTELLPAGELTGEEVKAGLAALLAATGDENPTGRALRDFAGAVPDWRAEKTAPFQSDRKWSGGSFSNGQSWFLGAGEMLFPGGLGPLEAAKEDWVHRGLRVVVLGLAHSPMGEDGALPDDLVPAGLIALSDTLRPSAPDTLAYFRDQGVTVKIISGDDPRTVAAVAHQAGVEGSHLWVDAATLDGEAATRTAAGAYTVFGRVSPQQKLWLIQALKEAGHTVAMTGDGVNDVQALKESDCGVAMAAGSEAARNVSQIVLMHSDFAAMPAIVAEGRRAINNLQRSSALFLTKTCFSILMAVCFLFLPMSYPFQPIQFTLISALTIGAPSFFLALEPNHERIRGRFRDNVFARALPGGIAMATDVLLCAALTVWFPMEPEVLSTLCVLLVGFGGLVNLCLISEPLNAARGCLLAAMTAGFYLGAWFFRDFFSLVLPLPGGGLWAVPLGLMGWTVLAYLGVRRSIRWLQDKKTPAV